MLKSFIFASSSAGKSAMVKSVAQEFGIQVLDLRDIFPNEKIEILEDQTSYLGNARKKAQTVYQRTQQLGHDLAVLGDDSGLEVDALSGKPGIFSARYRGLKNLPPSATDADRNQALLEELLPLRTPDSKITARYVSFLVLILPDGSEKTVSSAVPGEILPTPRGEGGFGYDPLFFDPKVKKTYAEFSHAELMRHGFRVLGLRKLFAMLQH
ncbi:non-canonical purine NTP pyrophosphatase [bacterium]|nr:non-canonical purine NTP pyrophosphatase [bacterium]